MKEYKEAAKTVLAFLIGYFVVAILAGIALLPLATLVWLVK